MQLPLAGLGSRLGARLIDLLLQGALIFLAILIVGASFDGSSVSEAIVTAVGIVSAFLVFWGYDVLFESFAEGRTPGKRSFGLRVVNDEGGPESFGMAAVRNLLRIVDEILTLTAAGLVSIAMSKRNQRLGDMAAGTLVIKDRAEEEGVTNALISVESLDGIEAARAWDTGALSDADLQAARRFLERRHSIARPARLSLASELAARLRPKVVGSEGVTDEQFLELLVATRSRSG